MTIPRYSELMLPVLKALADGRTAKISKLVRAIGQMLGLAEQDLQAVLSSGRRTVMYDRTSWAVTYMCKAGLLDRPQRGYVAITPRGRQAL